MTLRFDGKVAVVTGAGNGLGKAYALFFGSRGAKVVVNDLGGSHRGQGQSNSAAQLVVDQIKKQGGEAVANFDSVENGEKIIQTAVKTYGKVDILINNAGILRDTSLLKMKDVDWRLIMKVHLDGTFSCTRAAWPIMRQQGFGRIINTCSTSGMYGNFGQSNYSAAKLGIHGFTQTIAKEGEKRNIRANTICPISATRMTEGLMTKDMGDIFLPDNVVPLVAFLAHQKCQANGAVFEVGGGYYSQLRWQRAEGLYLGQKPTLEQLAKRFASVTDFQKKNEYPTRGEDVVMHVMQLRGKL